MNINELDDYKRRSLSEQILNEPDTFIGGCDEIEDILPLFKDNSIEVRTCLVRPALSKLFDEIIVNCRDQKTRLDEQINNNSNDIIPVTDIKVFYNDTDKSICIYNNGNGIDIAKHPSEKDENGDNIWIPELILGNLLTSKNYNKSNKTTGGKNGFGAKLVNLFSKWFRIETVDHIRNLKYSQEYTNNMTQKTKPKVIKTKVKPYTKISWILDFDRFGITGYSNDLLSILKRRIYDIAGTTDKSLSLYYNNSKLPIKSFDRYIDLYLNGEEKVYQKIHHRWEIGVSVSKSDKFEHYSFVNGIYTSKGGKHVDIITKQLTTSIKNYIKKKHKKDIPDIYIKNYLKVFINCIIEDPSFESQSKERLITSPTKFGSKPNIPDDFIKKVINKLSIIEKVIQFADFKENQLTNKNNGKKLKRVQNIPKLDDANWAGTAKSNQCTLILTEGDSAKTMAISGLKEIGRDKYGIYPLRGKFLNVKEATKSQLSNNSELIDLVKILGLKFNVEYKTVDPLRYGKVMIMTDQDHDGSHIKGLIINLFHTLWPSLLNIGILSTMITPIVKVFRKSDVKSFYNLHEYNTWCENTLDSDKWKCKYYKGLGTSTAGEAVEYFRSMRTMDILWTTNDDSIIELAFKKDQSNNRKEWLYNYCPGKVVNPNKESIEVNEFINDELIHFSNADTLRSIGSVIDGLKVSQRKVLYSCFERRLYSEIKVAQLSGYVSEKSSYHHGEASLQSTIIGMAQNFLGSNNINLLLPNGQFGSRIMGGSDSASARYIHTALNTLCKLLFPALDNTLLKYKEDDGSQVEPEYYVPIIPLILINGMVGIGTGFSTSIPKYNIKDIVDNIQRKLNGEIYKPLKPWYYGFKGTIHKIDSNSYISKGIYNIIGNTIIQITELPIGKWTNDYKQFLDSIVYDKSNKKPFQIKEYIDYSDDISVDIHITLLDNSIIQNNTSIRKHVDLIEDKLKLTTTKGLSLGNLHLYNSKNIIHKYTNIYSIIDEFYEYRYNLYELRKKIQLDNLLNDIKLYESKMRFITYVMDEKIIIYRKPKQSIIEQLYNFKFPYYTNQKVLDCTVNEGDYNYLLNLQIHSFTIEKVNELKNNINTSKSNYDELFNKSIKDIWISELNQLIDEYDRFYN
ncbi:MAG: hypothetical protein CMG46_02300 [Candidatus Marinimicrobia bacterium]|nr:hypothetical protein [Candidatus Neomarinimicrobiota bacterium]